MDNQFRNLNKKTKKKVIHQMNNFIVQNGEVYTYDGENISDKYNLQINPIYISDKQIKEYKSIEKLGEHERENGGFIFLFYQTLNNINELVPNLNKPEIARLMFLTSYVSFENNQILYDNGRNISDTELCKMLKLQKRQYIQYIKKLIDNNLLYIDEQGNRFISHSICKYGEINTKQLRKENISYIRLFKSTIRKIFNDTSSRELGRLSIIYMVLPYLNLTTNIISHNPDETEVAKIKPMTLMELANVLGYGNYSKLKSALNNVKIKDSYVFGFFQFENDKRTMKIVVNPNVVFAGNGKQLGTVKALFSK